MKCPSDVKPRFAREVCLRNDGRNASLHIAASAAILHGEQSEPLHFLSVVWSQQDNCLAKRRDAAASDSRLRTQSMDFTVSIIELVKELKAKHESIIANQIGRSGTSIGANIREAQYAHGKADFIAKLQIALKEANETGYWLELLYRTGYLSESEFKKLDSACTNIRVMLISSVKTAKENQS